MSTRRGVTERASAGRTLAQAGVMLIVLLVVVTLYTFAHEGGHAVLGLLLGGTLTGFSIDFWNLSASVGIEGDFGDAQRSLISLAGGGLAYLLWASLFWRAPGRIDPAAIKANATLAWLKLISAFAVVNTLLPWIAIPLLYLQGQAPPDDVTSFLQRSHLPPLLVAAAALAFYVGGWALFLDRAGGVRTVVAALRSRDQDPRSPASLATLRNLVALGVLAVSLAVAGNAVFAQTGAVGLPPDYQLARVVDLSAGGLADETVYRFTVDRPEAISFYFLLQRVEQGPVEIAMVGHNGYRSTFLRFGPEFNAGRASVHPQDLALPAGEYEIRLTFPRTPGKVTLYVKRGGG